MNNNASNQLRYWIKILIYSTTFALFYVPVIIILAKAFLGRDAFAHLSQFLNSQLFLNTLFFSVEEALLSAGLSLLLAFPGAYFFGRFDFPGKNVMRSIMVLPFMFPSILVVLGMIVFYGNNGVFNQLILILSPHGGWRFTDLYGFWGIILAHIFYNFTFCLRILGENWQKINPGLIEASQTLGANSFKTWRKIIFPLLLPTVIYLFVIVFLYAFLSFTIVLVLGGYLYKTFEVLIYIDYNQKLDFNRAAMIAVVQIVILAIIMGFQGFLSRKGKNNSESLVELPKLSFKRFPLVSSLFCGYLILAAFFLLGPFVTILSRSLNEGGISDGSFTFANYVLLFRDGFKFAVGKDFGSVFGTSLLISITVALITVAIAYWFARDRRKMGWKNVDLWLQLPLGISFLTFAFGLLILVGRYLPAIVLVIWAQVFLIFPLIYSMLKTSRAELGDSLLDVAATLGANRKVAFWSVEFPLMKKSIITALTYAMALSFGDLTAVLVLGRGDLITIPVAIYRLIGHYRFAQATALGSLFILAAFFIFIGLEISKWNGTKKGSS
jgi:thiamine transport system permease protein